MGNMWWILVACLALLAVAQGEQLGADLTIKTAARYVITLDTLLHCTA